MKDFFKDVICTVVDQDGTLFYKGKMSKLMSLDNLSKPYCILFKLSKNLCQSFENPKDVIELKLAKLNFERE